MDNILLAASFSGVIEVTLTHPLDVIKTLKQQNSSNFKYPNNFLGYYRGYGPRMVGAVPMRTLFWTCQYIYFKELEEHYSKNKATMMAGIGAGATQTIIDTPLELVKIQMISGKTLRESLKNNIFSGFTYNLYRNSIFTAFVAYSLYFSKENKWYHMALGGFIGSVVSQPFDYMKTLKQSNQQISFKILFKHFSYHRKYLLVGTWNRALMAFINMGIGGYVFKFFANKN